MTAAWQLVLDTLATANEENAERAHLTAGGDVTPPHVRLLHALRAGDAWRAGPADWVALIGHLLRAEWARVPGVVPSLEVPAPTVGSTIAWPTREAWTRADIRAEQVAPHLLRLTPRDWQPTWLPGGERLLRPLLRGEERRTYAPVPGDPFLRLGNKSAYRSSAQREAVRAVLAAPPGSTISVNLPTGAGKSLCAHLPALLESQDRGVTIVVVPTTALALDQEAAVRPWVGHSSAYIGGRDAAAVGRRREIGTRIIEGTQRIVFTSPESLLLGLVWPLMQAAKAGLLRYLVIDEAHMVDRWGDEFRPAFQQVAGIRQRLITASPGEAAFKTILLTATLTETALDTLETLFGRPGPLLMVSAAQLRPEPSYWTARAGSREAQEHEVLDALRHLPRPAILYVTEPRDAETWVRLLNAEGYRRVGLITGLTRTGDRVGTLGRWRDGDVDIMVATSAFGLGVDKADVRAVVHATVPENVDRYYQEVGRGGRDGCASVSLVVYTDADLAAARRMHRRTIIGIGRGQQRWNRMLNAAEPLGEGRLRLPVEVTPGTQGADLDRQNALNTAWNVRTLTLLSRAGVLAMDAEDELSASPLNGDAGTAASRGQRRPVAVVRLLNEGSRLVSVWQERVEPIRQRTARADRLSYQLMLDLLSGRRCFSEYFASAYRIAARPVDGMRPARPAIEVATACGGCPACRTAVRRPFAQPLPQPLPRWRTPRTVAPQLAELIGQQNDASTGGPRTLSIFYDELPLRVLRRVLQWLAVAGVRATALAADVREAAEDVLADAARTGAFVFTYPLESFQYVEAPAVPLLVLASNRDPLGLAVRSRWASSEHALVRVLIAPRDQRDPAAPHRLLRHTIEGRVYQLDEFLSMIGL